MLLTDEFLIAIYNFLEVDSDYRSDLVDLFGTPDASRKGYLGSISKPLSWDWGDTGFKKIINIMYCLSNHDPNGFESFLLSNIRHKDKIVQALISNHIIDKPPRMLYVFRHSAKKIPAFVARIHDMAWVKRRVWITFQPEKYMILDPNTWKGFWNKLFTDGREDPRKWFDTWELSWSMTRPQFATVQQMLHSGFTQDQYHVIPVKLLIEHMKREVNPISETQRTCLIKNIIRNDKRLRLRVPTDNQAFWGILSEFIGASQVKGKVILRHNRGLYTITEIPSNTISEDSLVFKQEIGTARTICQAMLDVFGEDYLKVEFAKGSEIELLDSTFLKRAVKVSMVARDYDRKFGETDFDYQLDLNPLSTSYPKMKMRILFDLTAGLWNKSSAKSKEEFLKQWEHNIIKLPEMNDNLLTVWHYGLVSEVKDGSYKGLEIGEYLMSGAKAHVVKYRANSIKDSVSLPKAALLPFFRDAEVKLEKELAWISSDNEVDRRKSSLYGALKEILERLKVEQC